MATPLWPLTSSSSITLKFAPAPGSYAHSLQVYWISADLSGGPPDPADEPVEGAGQRLPVGSRTVTPGGHGDTWSPRHAAPNEPFGTPPIEAKLVEDGIGLVDTVHVLSVMQHCQRLSGAGAAFDLLPVEKFGHGLLWFTAFAAGAWITFFDPGQQQLSRRKSSGLPASALPTRPLVPSLSRDIHEGPQWRRRAGVEKSSDQPFRWRLRRVPAPSAIPPP